MEKAQVAARSQANLTPAEKVSQRVRRVFNTRELIQEGGFHDRIILEYTGYRSKVFSPSDAKLMVAIAECDEGKMKLLHRHPGSDSVLVWIEGEGEYLTGGGEAVPARPGDILLSPNGLPHGVRNTGKGPCRWLFVEGPEKTVDLPNDEIRSPSDPALIAQFQKD